MAKAVTNKATKKVAKKKAPKQEETIYQLYVKLNDTEFTFDTNDILADLLSVKPEFLRTPVVIRVTLGDKTLDRYFFLNQGKRLFRDRYAQEYLIRNLTF